MAKMMIALQAVLLSILCLCMWEEASSTREMNQTISSKCPSTCGGVHIPYPFGVGERCSRDKGFEIMCNYTSRYGFKPFLAVSRNEVGYISLQYEQKIRVKVPTTKRCNNNTSGKRQGAGYMVFNFMHSPFTLSAEMNMLVGRGCDVFARITDLTNQKLVTGCFSVCPTGVHVRTYGSCSGIGCCKAPIPMGLKAFNVTLEPLNIETQSSAFNSDSCSYASVGDGGNASLEDISYAYNENMITPTTTLYLDWAIGDNRCKEAKKNLTSYACKSTNSDCSKSTNGLGYVCKCSKGYYGNAYLPNGCQAYCGPQPREMDHTISSECPSTCGGVDIPYPFGVGERCSRDKGFEIMCNYTRDEFGYYGLTPFLAVSRNEVVDIWLQHRQNIRVKVPSTKRCKNNTSGKRQGAGYMVFNFTYSPFTSSAEINTLVGRGCDVFARITDLTNQEFVSGCVSLCPTDVKTYGSCSGIGCCTAHIPKGLKAFNVTLEPLSIETKSSAFNSDGCSYASLEDSSYASLEDMITPTTPLYLDWAIGEKTCEEAKKDLTSYACNDTNSDCDSKSTNGLGYVCKCRKGYYGNPYLRNGCQYVGDCNDCVHQHYCYHYGGENPYCYCPSGWIGDGRKDGSGCTPTRTPTRISYILIGIVVGMGLLALLAGGFFLLYNKLRKMEQTKTKQKFFKQNGGLLLEQQVSLGKANIENTKIFVAEELEKATDNFNQNRVVGSGGFGTVYKGMLSDGRIVAIKKSKLVDKAQIGQFINELVILSHINHKNVVRLLGCCLETEVPLLAYEFIPNGTLSYHLHDEDKKSSLSWENRLRIANELASALSYLHSSTSTPIFHRDIKSCNILLDENYRAKASDFGISRSVPNERSHLTTIVQGTFGYLDPEYFRSSQFTDKSDVYSFGVVLVELLTGRKPVLVISSEEVQNTIMCFRSSMKENRVLEIIEPRVLNEGRQGELLTVAKLAKNCLKSVGKKRPTMKEVSMELEGLRKLHEQQCVAQTFEESENWLHDSSCISFSGLESEDTGKIACQERQHRGFRHAQSLSITRYHDLKSSINATT